MQMQQNHEGHCKFRLSMANVTVMQEQGKNDTTAICTCSGGCKRTPKFEYNEAPFRHTTMNLVCPLLAVEVWYNGRHSSMCNVPKAFLHEEKLPHSQCHLQVSMSVHDIDWFIIEAISWLCAGSFFYFPSSSKSLCDFSHNLFGLSFLYAGVLRLLSLRIPNASKLSRVPTLATFWCGTMKCKNNRVP